MRPEWDAYFAEIAELIARRSTCLRAKHGALIVRDNRILCTGYNGSPSGALNCVDVGSCYRQENNIPSGQQYEKCRALHAEHNVILQAARFGIAIDGATIYVDDDPCELCAKQIHGSGIKEIVILSSSGRYCNNALEPFVATGGTVRYYYKEKKKCL